MLRVFLFLLLLLIEVFVIWKLTELFHATVVCFLVSTEKAFLCYSLKKKCLCSYADFGGEFWRRILNAVLGGLGQ